jgi:hypothetical protein
MPAFGNRQSLTQQEIADLEAYVLRLNGVDRGRPMHPGVEPRRFFLALLMSFLMLSFVVVAIYWIWHRIAGGHRTG